MPKYEAYSDQSKGSHKRIEKAIKLFLSWEANPVDSSQGQANK